MTSDDRLVFLHFEKTAGTTVSNILRTNFDPAVVFPERSAVVRYWPSTTLEPYRLYTIHAALSDLASIPKPLKLVTFLREPTDRIVSLYRYWTSFRDEAIANGNLVFPRYAKAQRFEEFLSPESINTIPSLWNIYTQSLAGSFNFAPDRKPWRSERELLDAALRNVELFEFIGIFEHMDASIGKMQSALGLLEHREYTKENVTDDLHKADPSTYETPRTIEYNDRVCDGLHEVTRLDRILFETVLRGLKINDPSSKIYRSRCGAGGHQIFDSGEDWIISQRPNDCLMFGPYASIPKGHFRASFRVRTDPALRVRGNAGLVDIVANGGRLVKAKRFFHEARSGDPFTVNIEFSLDRPIGDIEFRVYSCEYPGLSVVPLVTVEKLFG